jgi:hypothetical protein
MLKDEILSASNNHASLRATTDGGASGNAPRYTDAAGVENHPQITDFVPRHYGTIAVLVLLGAGLTAVMAALHFFALPIAVSSGMQSTAALDLTAYGSLSAWLAAVVLLLASAACLLTYSIRRHRIDDFRGRYRVWLGAALACLVMSANSVAGVHQVVADVLGHFTGWTALREGAVWWLLLSGLPIGWIALRTLLDMRECRVAAALLVAAVISYTVSAATFLGLAVMEDPRVKTLTIGASLLLGHWFVLASVVSYTRFIVLDAQGLITARRRTTTKRVKKAESIKTAPAPSAAAATKSTPTVLSAGGYTRQTLPTATTPADSSRWVDGTRQERDRYERDEEDDEEDSSGDDRKLSKSDRKKLRKLKAQGRAA